jgi:hypothetical protein
MIMQTSVVVLINTNQVVRISTDNLIVHYKIVSLFWRQFVSRYLTRLSFPSVRTFCRL